MTRTPSEVAAHAAIWGLIETEAKARKNEAREWLSRHMGDDVAAVKAVANGVTIGKASWVEGKTAFTVFDDSAFLQYVGAKHPTELVTTVNSAFQEALFSNLKTVGDSVIDKDGEPVPGVRLRQSASFVSVTKTPAARATVEGLLSSGRLQLDGITHPELEGEQ